MTQAEREICDELILHANHKEEVMKSVLEARPKTNKLILKTYVDKQWLKKLPSNRISLRQKSYKEKKAILENLLFRKEAGRINHIYLYLTKNLSNQTPYELYINIIGRERMIAPFREGCRGRKVELISFSADNAKLVISANNTEYYFLIYDIDTRMYVEVD